MKRLAVIFTQIEVLTSLAALALLLTANMAMADPADPEAGENAKPGQIDLSAEIPLPTAAQVLTYERTFSEVAGDNRLTIAIDDGGWMTVHRPPVMTSSGDYLLPVNPAIYADLAAEFAALHGAGTELEARVGRRATAEMAIVADADRIVFRWDDAARSRPREIHFHALDAWVKRYPDDADLQRLAVLERRIRELMDEQLRGAGHE